MSAYEIDVEEVDYLRHGDRSYRARIHKPRGDGPFPAVVEVHGGAWCTGDRTGNDTINRAMAQNGVVVAALDFRNPPEATYPGSVQDVNYGVRWLKSQAPRFKTRPDWVGSMGTSSGGHLVVLSGLKPFDPRYRAIPLPGAEFDARVPFVVTMWPVICPLGRYHDRKAKLAGAEAYPGRGGGVVAMQEKYWLTEAAMGEGSPVLALARGDEVELPKILYLQHPADEMHPRHLMEQFVTNYRARGGTVNLRLFEGEKYDLPRSDPSSPAAKAVIADIAAFICGQTG